MRKTLKRLLPDHQTVSTNRWLRPFASTLLHPRLWHLNRHSAAGAVAAGMFCGLIPGPLQMVGAAICALVFRVNLPLAMFLETPDLGYPAWSGSRTAAASNVHLQPSTTPLIDYTDEPIERVLADWHEVSLLLNRFSRAMGQNDLYPFVLNAPTEVKLGFMHRIVTRITRRSATTS